MPGNKLGTVKDRNRDIVSKALQGRLDAEPLTPVVAAGSPSHEAAPDIGTELVADYLSRRMFLSKAVIGGASLIGLGLLFGVPANAFSNPPTAGRLTDDYLSLVPRASRPTDIPQGGLWLGTDEEFKMYNGTWDVFLRFPIFNVKSFGAKADGVTDDKAAIQAAIDAVPVSGGIVFFPPGAYNVQSTLSIDKSSVHIRGAGPGATILSAGSGMAAAHLLSFGSATQRTDLSISDLSITSAVSKTDGAAIQLNTVFRAMVRNVAIKFHVYGVRIVGTPAIIFLENLDVRDTQTSNGVGISIEGGNDHFQSNIVVDNAVQPLAGIRILKSAATWISNVDVIHCSRGLLLDPQGTDFVEHLFVQNSAFDSCSNQGILINPAVGATVRRSSFIGCWTSTNDTDGVALDTGTIQAIRFLGHRSYNNAGNGFLVNVGTDTEISLSEISGNSRTTAGAAHGISVAPGVSGFRLLANRSGQLGGFGNTQGWGILVNAGSSNNYEVLLNDVRGNLTAGLSDGGTGSSKRIYANLGVMSAGVATLIVGPSPFTYVNNDGVPEAIYIRGGTLVTPFIQKNATTIFNATPATVWLEPGESVTLWFSAAPGMTKDRK